MATETTGSSIEAQYANETKLMSTETPNAPQHHDDAGHEGLHMDLKPIGTGKVILFAIIFVVLFALLFVVGYQPFTKSHELAAKQSEAAENDKPLVDIAMPKPPENLPALELPGDAQPFQWTSIFPRTSGYLKSRLVDIGDHVKAGQLLAEIDTPEVDAQLAAAKATLEQAKATTQRAKDDYDLAEATYQRYQGFSKGGGVTQQQLDERKSAYTQAKSTLAGAEATQRADEAEVARLTALVSYEKVVAPFTGVITSRNYDVGALLSANSTQAGKEMFQIQETDVLRVFVNLPQSYAAYVKAGQSAQFIVNNFPGRPFDGKVARTSSSIDQNTRTLRVEIDCPNPDGTLYAGMYGYIRYEVQTKQDKLMIPSSALVFGPEGLTVAKLDGGNKVSFQKIDLGRDLGTEVEVTKGLSANDRIVANPGERLTDGVEVQIAAKRGSDKATASAAGNGNLAGQREANAK